MKLTSIPIVIIALMLSISLSAQNSFNLKDFTVTIAGTSTLHDWVSDVTKVKTTAKLNFQDGKLAEINALEVSIPVKGIISTKGSIMDNKTYNALKSKEHPNIYFTLLSASVTPLNSNAVKVNAQGRLTIAGVSKKVSLSATGKQYSSSIIEFKGAKTLDMTHYGVAPPTAVMGTIKTGKEVTINYSIKLISNTYTTN